MAIDQFEELDSELEDFNESPPVIAEVNPSTKLERRRKIEDLFEEKRLREEISEFA
jgi:hypothetical protein